MIKETEIQAQVEIKKQMDLLRHRIWHTANETYCWLNAKHNASVRMPRQPEPEPHTGSAKEWDLQTSTLLNNFPEH